MKMTKITACRPTSEGLEYEYLDEKGNAHKALEPFIVDGKDNSEKCDVIYNAALNTQNELQTTPEPVVIPEGEYEDYDDDYDFDEELGENAADYQDIQEAEYEELDDKKKKKFKLKSAAMAVALLGLGAALALVGSASLKNRNTDSQEITTEVTTNLIDELDSDSRYTSITEDMLAQTTIDFKNELEKHGIEVTSADALTYVTVANITHINETNPELLARVIEDSDSYTVLGKVGHVLGQIVTNEVTEKDDTVDVTVAYMDETDKAIAQHHMDMISDSKEILNNEKYPEAEQIGRVQAIINTQFVQPSFDKTVGYNLADGTHTALTLEDGAAWTMNAYVSGVLLGDNVLKQAVNAENSYVSSTVYNPEKHTYELKDYVNLGNNDSTWMVSTYSNEVSNDVQAIGENAGFTPDLMKYIDNACNSIEPVQATKSMQ